MNKYKLLLIFLVLQLTFLYAQNKADLHLGLSYNYMNGFSSEGTHKIDTTEVDNNGNTSTISNESRKENGGSSFSSLDFFIMGVFEYKDPFYLLLRQDIGFGFLSTQSTLGTFPVPSSFLNFEDDLFSLHTRNSLGVLYLLYNENNMEVFIGPTLAIDLFIYKDQTISSDDFLLGFTHISASPSIGAYADVIFKITDNFHLSVGCELYMALSLKDDYLISTNENLYFSSYAPDTFEINEHFSSVSFSLGVNPKIGVVIKI